jgi:hypothetical protein
MKLKSIESDRVNAELTNRVNVLETDAVRRQEEVTLLTKKLDIRTILAHYLMETQDRYVRRINAVEIDIGEVRKLAKCMSVSDWNTFMDNVEKENSIEKVLDFLKNKFPLDIVHAEATAMRRIIENFKKSPGYQKDTS